MDAPRCPAGFGARPRAGWLPRGRALALVAIVLYCPGAGAEALFGGNATVFGRSYLSETEEGLLAESSLGAEIEASLDAVADPATLGLALGLRQAGAAEFPELRLKRALIEVPAGDYLAFKAGYFRSPPGSAHFLGCLDLFSVPSTEALASLDAGDSARPAFLVQATGFLGPAYLRLSAAPLRPEAPLLDLSSRWFPRSLVPAKLPSFLDSGTESSLRKLIWVTDKREASYPEDMSVQAELGFSSPLADLELLYFDGQDPAPLYRTELALVTDESLRYDLRLTPLHRRTRALGASITSSTGDVRLWADALCAFDRFLTIDAISVGERSVFSTSVAAFRTLDLVAGASLELPELSGASLMVEWKPSWVLGPADSAPDIAEGALTSLESVHVKAQTGASAPENRFLADLLFAAAGAKFLDSRLELQGLSALSLADGSSALGLRLSLNPSAELSLSALGMVFLGESGSELGQFADNRFLNLSATLRF